MMSRQLGNLPKPGRVLARTLNLLGHCWGTRHGWGTMHGWGLVGAGTVGQIREGNNENTKEIWGTVRYCRDVLILIYQY